MVAEATTASGAERLTPCDLVMKGGVASGIVYPGAIAELAEHYQLHGIGGSSAGAIGALGAAAAELGRYRRGDDSSFEQVRNLADELASDQDIIAGLFQPQRSTKRLFDGVVALSDAQLGRHEWVIVKYLVALWTIIRYFPLWAAIGGGLAALPGVLFVIPAARLVSSGGWLDVAYLVVIAVLALIGIIIGASIGILYDAQRVLRINVKANLWGMCTGLTDPRRKEPLALTDWMVKIVDDFSSPQPEGMPVTFGDLWYADKPHEYKRGEHTGGAPDRRAIDLQVITTCLSDGQPYRFPFQPELDDRQRFYFKVEDMERLFPSSIVGWLTGHPDDGTKVEDEHHPLPNPADLPIVMAARLSLSFPGLLSAVPLYRKMPDGQFRKCWFSDGGIASNFPIHFFDSPLPRWPTLAINLAGPPETECSDEDWGRVPDTCQRRSIWDKRSRHSDLENVTDFAVTLFNTARNWSDNTQADLPGYQDRIIFVGMNSGEGGLNLNMPKPIRKRLSERGELAGSMLRDRFHVATASGPQPTAAWETHRWTRYRLSMASIQEFLGSFHRGYNYSPAHPSYLKLIDRGLLANDPYRWENAVHHEAARKATTALNGLAAGLQDLTDPRFSVNAPKPPPELRPRPRI
jgi:predicted acylesterase/phospholipase RssA